MKKKIRKKDSIKIALQSEMRNFYYKSTYLCKLFLNLFLYESSNKYSAERNYIKMILRCEYSFSFDFNSSLNSIGLYPHYFFDRSVLKINP